MLNEAPDASDLFTSHGTRGGQNNDGMDDEDSKLGSSAVLRTTSGDVQVKLFPSETPRMIENFADTPGRVITTTASFIVSFSVL